MGDADKTKKQLLDELGKLRQRVAELEGAGPEQAGPEDGRLAALYAIAQIVSRTFNLDELLQSCIDRVAAAVRADVAAIYLIDAGQRALALKAQTGMTEGAAGEASSLLLSDEELQGLQRWKGPDTDLSEVLGADIAGRLSAAMLPGKGHSLAAAPLLSRGQVRGAVLLSVPADAGIDTEFVEVVGNQISVGIESATLYEKAEELSLTDELTGLYNRRYFYIVLHQELNRAQRYGPASSLILMDIDGFKDYNSRFGHTAGDSALKALAWTIAEDLRKTDTAFRYGGDEFALILPATDAEGAALVSERIRSKWAQVSRVQYGTQESALGLSAGIVEFPRDADTADGLILLAETALVGSRGEGGSKSTQAFELGVLHTGFPENPTVDQVYALAATVDARDPYAYGHRERVAATAEIIGEAIGLSEEEMSSLRAAALLHDIGKVAIPDAIVTKPDELSESEWEVIRRHPVEGAALLEKVGELAGLAQAVRHHHESYDGSGYPDGLKGDDIPLASRIILIADAYDTMTTYRPYRNVVSIKEACNELRRGSGSQFDPEIVEAFVRAKEASAGLG